MKKIVLLILMVFSLSGCEFFSMVQSLLNYGERTQPSSLLTDGNYLYRTIRRNSDNGSNPNTQLERINLETGARAIIAGNNNNSTVDGNGTLASFITIRDMAIQLGNPSIIYLSDQCVIRRLDTTTLDVTTVLGSSGQCGNVNGTGAAAQLATPYAMVIVGQDLFFSGYTSIKKVDLTTFTMTDFVGSYNTGGNLDGNGTSARFGSIKSMTAIGDQLYVTDVENFNIRVVDINTREVTTLIGNGVQALTDGSTDASFFFSGSPRITSDGENFLYLTDNGTVRKIDVSKKEVSTILNASLVPEDRDGELSTATTFYPSGIVYSPEGLFISNFWGIRRIR